MLIVSDSSNHKITKVTFIDVPSKKVPWINVQIKECDSVYEYRAKDYTFLYFNFINPNLQPFKDQTINWKSNHVITPKEPLMSLDFFRAPNSAVAKPVSRQANPIEPHPRGKCNNSWPRAGSSCGTYPPPWSRFAPPLPLEKGRKTQTPPPWN